MLSMPGRVDKKGFAILIPWLAWETVVRLLSPEYHTSTLRTSLTPLPVNFTGVLTYDNWD